VSERAPLTVSRRAAAHSSATLRLSGLPDRWPQTTLRKDPAPACGTGSNFMFLFFADANGVAGEGSAAQLGVTYRLRVALCHLIRLYMASFDGDYPMGGDRARRFEMGRDVHRRPRQVVEDEQGHCPWHGRTGRRCRYPPRPCKPAPRLTFCLPRTSVLFVKRARASTRTKRQTQAAPEDTAIPRNRGPPARKRASGDWHIQFKIECSGRQVKRGNQRDLRWVSKKHLRLTFASSRSP